MPNQEKQREVSKTFHQIINAFTPNEDDYAGAVIPAKNTVGKIKIVPNFILDIYGKQMKVEFKIGTTKLYRLKDLSLFYDRMLQGENYKYGGELEFIHKKEAFAEDCHPLLDFILKYAEIIKYVNVPANDGYKYYGKTLSDHSIILSNTGIDEIFEILKGKKISFQNHNLQEKTITLIPNEPNINFCLSSISEKQASIKPNIEVLDYMTLDGKEYSYILIEDMFYRITKEFRSNTLKVLEIFRKNFKKEVICYKKELPDFFSFVMPKLKEHIVLDEKDKKELEAYIPSDVTAKLFLDYDKNGYIIAILKFCYDNIEFNPIEDTADIKLARNTAKEAEILNILRKTGFLLDQSNARFVLVDEDVIFQFLTEEIEEYGKKFELFATNEFKNKQIIKPKINGIGVKIENNLLTIDLSEIGLAKEEIKEILEKYRLKKKYHRLKNGTFMNLKESKDIEFLNNLEYGLGLDTSSFYKNIITVPVYRSMYLNRILENMKETKVEKDDTFQSLINNIEGLETIVSEVPEKIQDTLRYYQKVGYNWLKTIDRYGLGGILADDMGLRKNSTDFICNIITYRKHKKRR